MHITKWAETDIDIHSLVVFLGFLEKLLQATRGHVFCNEYDLWHMDGKR